LEFHADLAIPYRAELHSVPMHGQFLLVQLESPDEAVLGRITSFSSEGKLSVGSGEEFNIRAVRDGREVPEDLREQYLKYRVNIRVLGVLRNGAANHLTFVASHRRLPHVGSPVAFLSGDILREVAGHNDDGAVIGHFALGESIYDPGRRNRDDWMRLHDPEVQVKFDIKNLVSRRSFIFARARFGKSNLNKLLFSQLYKETPVTTKRGGRPVPVGTIIFDPDGEYFWPDYKGRPGLCDVDWLEDKLVVFTSRRAPSLFYGSFIAGGIRLDIRDLRPADVISIALPPERQDQQNVAKLRGLSPDRWRQMVDLVHADGNGADLNRIGSLLNLTMPNQEAEAVAARSNMTNVVRMLHDPGSQLMHLLLDALRHGKLCVIDVSQMRGAQAFVLAGIILRRIFSHNQEQFTEAEPRTIPTIVVIEEAQAVLNERAAASKPYLAWVKEGRKYDLGAVLVTQQPGAIPDEILSQGDNWFLFHLLAGVDLSSTKRANAHFSNDILSSLLNEPISGHGVFWSSASPRPYPIPLRVASFEDGHQLRDPSYSRGQVETAATGLRRKAADVIDEAQGRGLTDPDDTSPDANSNAASPGDIHVDLARLYDELAFEAVRDNPDIKRKLKKDGVPWGERNRIIGEALPKTLQDADRRDRAYQLVAPTLERLYGRQDIGWHSFTNPQTGKRWVKEGPAPRNPQGSLLP
jgi:uncharacterized protein